MLKTVETKTAAQPVGHYHQAIVHDGVVYTAGQIALCPTSHTFLDGGGDVVKQAEVAYGNLAAVLEAAGAALHTVMKLCVYLVDVEHAASVNDVARRYFGEFKPARSTMVVQALPMGALIEVDAIAALASDRT